MAAPGVEQERLGRDPLGAMVEARVPPD